MWYKGVLSIDLDDDLKSWGFLITEFIFGFRKSVKFLDSLGGYQIFNQDLVTSS
jgi:hypothetical protein